MTRNQASPIIYANPPAPVFYIGTIGIVVPIGTLIGILLRVPEYWGWPVLIVADLLGIALLIVAESRTVFTSVEIGKNHVVLRAPFRKVNLHSQDIDRVELNPPVSTLSMVYSWWKRPSICIIHRKISDPNRVAAHRKNPWMVTEYRYSEQPIDVTTMPDGLKRRIAQTLDPAHWPPLPEPQQV